MKGNASEIIPTVLKSRTSFFISGTLFDTFAVIFFTACNQHRHIFNLHLTWLTTHVLNPFCFCRRKHLHLSSLSYPISYPFVVLTSAGPAVIEVGSHCIILRWMQFQFFIPQTYQQRQIGSSLTLLCAYNVDFLGRSCLLPRSNDEILATTYPLIHIYSEKY